MSAAAEPQGAARELIASLNAKVAAQVETIRRKDAEIAELKRVMLGRGDAVRPVGSDEDGWCCPVTGCWADVEHPYEQGYCMGCGVKFEWSPAE